MKTKIDREWLSRVARGTAGFGEAYPAGRPDAVAKKLTATQFEALSALADGEERLVHRCGPTNTVVSLHTLGLISPGGGTSRSFSVTRRATPW